MNQVDTLIESFLMEAVALTPGSTKVLNNKDLVSKLANELRSDSRFNPSIFPPNSYKTFKSAPDEEVARWFLEQLDKIEREGYDNILYYKNKAYSNPQTVDWVVRNYINGTHAWEDIVGKLSMVLCDWILLKSRVKGTFDPPEEDGGEPVLRTSDVLDPAHQQLSSFRGIHNLAFYLIHHYGDITAAMRAKSKNVARDKLARNIKLVDNDDYKVFSSLNRAANCKLGLGTVWCTTNSNEDVTLFDYYANQSMLFQVFPKDAKHVDIQSGSRRIVGSEKYQFGADKDFSFKNIGDLDPNRAEIKARFPYLITDIIKALTENKAKIEEVFDKLEADDELQSKVFGKTKRYDIDKEIKKLKSFVANGKLDDKVRPPEKAKAAPAAPAAPTVEQPAEQPPAPPDQPQMESVRELANSMLQEGDDQYLGKITRDGDILRHTDGKRYSGELDTDSHSRLRKMHDDDWALQKSSKYHDDVGLEPEDGEGFTTGAAIADRAYSPQLPQREPEHYSRNDKGESLKIGMIVTWPHEPGEFEVIGGDQHQVSLYDPVSGSKFSVGPREIEIIRGVSEDEEGMDLGTMGSGTGPTAGVKYPPGTAPTMPESINYKGIEIMENIDKDVAAMLNSLKKYDKLVESCAPVLGMRTLTSKIAEEKEEVEEDEDETNIEEEGLEEATDKKPALPTKEKEPVKKKPLTPFGSDKKDELEESDWSNLGSEYHSTKSSTGGKTTTNGSVTRHEAKPKTARPATDKVSGEPRSGSTEGGSSKSVSSDSEKPFSSDDLEESADQDVLAWMNRFSKLGNMKGYGR